MELIKSSLFHSPNLAGYYQMEGNGNNTKSGAHGTPSNVVFGNQYGKFGQGALFNDSNSQINMGNVFNFGKGSPFSITLWAHITSGAGYNNLVNKQTGSGSFRGWGFELTPNYKPSLFLRRGSGNNFARNTADDVPTNKWVFLAATYSGNNNRSGINLYVDGKPVPMQDGGEGSSISSGDITDGGASLGIGRRIEGGGSPYGGYMDDVAIWTRELTADEVKKIYQKPGGSFLSLL